MARGRGRVGECETVPLDLGNCFYARCGVGDDAGPICIGLVVRSSKSGDRLRFRDLMREHITKRAELADFELAVAHGLDLGVVAGRNKYLDLTAELVADQFADLLVD